MSRRRILCLILPVMACRGTRDDTGAAGTLRLEREGQLLVEAPASASRCSSDSTIALVALGDDWVAALSMKVAWPAESARTLAIAAEPGPAGTAVVAARPVRDSVGLAIVAARGEVRLEPGPVLGGGVEALAPTQPGAPDTVRLRGRFDRVQVTDDLCPGAATP